MGPKKRVSVAERQQRSNAASTSKKRPATAFTHTIISTRKAIASEGSTTSTSPKKSNLKQTTSPAKKTLKFADKEKEAVQFETILEKTEGNKCEKIKVEEKKTTRASSRENVSRATSNLPDKTNTIKKEDSVTLETSSNSCASTASSSNCSATCSLKIGGDKNHDKKDEKTKAISKMLKSLDIKISGFDNILPKNEIITDLGLKSSISENVKTKSRAAAVKVIASMSPPKPMKRTKNDEEKKKLTQKQQQQQYKNIIQHREKETCEKIDSTKNKNHKMSSMEETDMNEVVIKEGHEIVLSVIENKKKMATKKAKVELNEQKGSKKIQTVKMKKINHRNDNDLEYEDQLIKELETKSSNTTEDMLIGEDKKNYVISTTLKSPKSKTSFTTTDCKHEMEKEKDGEKPTNEITLPKIDSNVGKNNRNSKILNTTTMLNKKLSTPKSLIADQSKNTKPPPILEEKEEILKVVLDANTEVIQMEIEEISSNILKKGAVESTEIKSPQIILEGNKEKASHQSRDQGSFVQDDTKKLITHLKEKRIPNIKHRIQAKFKANPIETKMSVAPINKTSTITKLLAQKQTQTTKSDPKKEGSKDDIYDFKSGSEEEEFIKMDLPTLKDLREFSEEDNEPLKASPKRGTPKFGGFRDKLKKEAQQEANTHKEDSQKQQKADKNTLIIDAKHSKEKTLPQKLSENTTKKLFKTKVANIKTKKQKNLKQNEKVSKIVKGRYAKKGNRSNEKSENDASENEDGLTSESNDSEDEQKLSMFSQKRQRMASLNALAKVQCLYENESRTAYELGLSKATLMPPKIRTVDGSDDERDKDKDKVKEKDVEKAKTKEKDKLEKDKNPDKNKDTTKERSKLKKDNKVNEDPLKIEDAPKEGSEDEPVEELKRELRNVFGGRGLGKHWELDSDSEAEEAERLKLKKKKLQKKMQIKKEKELEKEKAKERIKDAEDKMKGETITNHNKNKEPIKIKRKYTKMKKPLKKVLKLAIASSEDEANSAASENEGDNNKDDDLMHKSKLETKKPPKKRKRIFKEDLIGDYKGILARKRMASLNATAIVAATYEVERHLDKNLESECSSYDGYDGYEDKEKTTNKKFKDTVKYIAKEHSTPLISAAITESKSKELSTGNNCMLITTPPTKTPPKIDKPQNICEDSNDSKYSKETKETNTDATTTTSTNTGNATSSGTSKDSSRPTSSSVVIVQDTDVTITGVYVNSSAGSGQEAYCKMQYRVQSSVTEERLLRPGSADPPPKSYTPLSALSSMLPPGASAGVTSAANEGHSASTSPLPSGNNTQQPSNIPHVDVINPVAALYHSADLGIHTEHPSTEQHHGPPPPSYAAAAAAAAAAYHVHHLSPQATPHHQHQYAHAHAHHQYQQAPGGEHHGMPPPPHHYVSARPTPHYGPPPLPGSPPPTYRASNAYPTPIPAPHPPPSVGGSGAFCPTNSHPMQQHQALSSVTSLPTSSTTQTSTPQQHQQQQHHQHQLSGQSTSNETSGDSIENVCKEVSEQLNREKRTADYDNLPKFIQEALDVGQNLGIVYLTNGSVRLPLNYRAKVKNAALTVDSCDSCRCEHKSRESKFAALPKRTAYSGRNYVRGPHDPHGRRPRKSRRSRSRRSARRR